MKVKAVWGWTCNKVWQERLGLGFGSSLSGRPREGSYSLLPLFTIAWKRSLLGILTVGHRGSQKFYCRALFANFPSFLLAEYNDWKVNSLGMINDYLVQRATKRKKQKLQILKSAIRKGSLFIYTKRGKDISIMLPSSALIRYGAIELGNESIRHGAAWSHVNWHTLIFQSPSNKNKSIN